MPGAMTRRSGPLARPGVRRAPRPRRVQYGQRGWNRQPDGGAARSGGEPGIPVSRSIGPCSGGNESEQPDACTGGAGRRGARAAGASSTISPAYMIAMRSASSTSSERSCVMKSTAKPSSRLQLADLLQDLALHDHVERGRRLVHDHELGPQGERHRDHDALAHAAGQLVRVGAKPVGGRCRRARAARRRAPAPSFFEIALVRAHHVDELVADAHAPG